MEPKGFGPNRTLDLLHSNQRSHPIKKATLTKSVGSAEAQANGRAG